MAITPSTALSLGDRLSRARETARLNQNQLATALGISRVSVSNYENDTRSPAFALVCAWAVATNVPLSFFADATLSDGEEAPTICLMQDGFGVESAAVIDLTAPFPHSVPTPPTPDAIELPFIEAA